jgi:hypothetical protein
MAGAEDDSGECSTDPAREGDEMANHCAWMSGPKEAAIQVPAVKWWLAISRDVLVQGYRRQQQQMTRNPAHCHLTPKFTSPLVRRS